MVRPQADYDGGVMPLTTFVVTLATVAIAIGIMFLGVYSGLFNGEMWTVALCAFFLPIHAIAGWAYRRKPKEAPNARQTGRTVAHRSRDSGRHLQGV
jgi:hypothetical protein